MIRNIKKYEFYETKYGDRLLIDMIRLESLAKYIDEGCPHYLTYYDITLLTGGKGNFHIDQYKYSLKPGTILVSSPGQVRYWDVDVLPNGYVLIFEEEFLNVFLNDLNFISDLKYFNSYPNPPKLDLPEDDYNHLINLMENLEQEIKTFGSNDQYILQALLYQTLVWLNRKYKAAYQSSQANDFNRYIRQYIHLVDNEFHHHQSVSYYAQALNITPGHLNDLCKLHLGVNAKQYIQNRIFTEAKKLLLYSDLQITEIAFNLNFDDPSYFTRKFRQVTGITPHGYRGAKSP